MDEQHFPFAPNAGKAASQTVFIRVELDHILSLYGRMVAAGEWRDYSISHRRDEAVFAIHRRASEQPVYQIIKQPALARRQGMWMIRGAAGQVVKRGHKLDQVLRYFDKKQLRLVR